MRLDTHLIKTQQKVIMEKQKLSQLSPYMNFKQRKVIYSTKLKSLVEYCHPLLASQPQQIRKQAETLNMMINRWILKENTFCVRNETICRKIECSTPNQAIIQCGAKFIHKLITTNSTPSLSKLIDRPRRITAQHYYNKPKKRTNRTPVEALTNIYNQMTYKEKSLNPKALKRRLKKSKLKFKYPE